MNRKPIRKTVPVDVPEEVLDEVLDQVLRSGEPERFEEHLLDAVHIEYEWNFPEADALEKLPNH